MRGKTDLFHLIHSLSKSEKRYFTLDAQKSGRKSSRYLELFQAINKQETYEEQALKRKFGRSLADDKARLYEAILRSMRDYRSAKSYTARIKEMLLDAKFLYERGLYDQCEERLGLAKELAFELGDNLAALEINKEQRRLVKDSRPNDLADQIVALISEKDVIEKQLQEEHYFLDLHDRLYLKISQYPHKLSDEQKKKVEAEFAPLLKLPAPGTIKARIRYYLCHFFLSQLLGQQDLVYDYGEKIVQTWEEAPKFKEEEFYLYIIHASNLIHAAFSDIRKHQEKIPGLLSKLSAETPTRFHDEKMLFEKIALYQLLYHINTGDFQYLEQELDKIEAGLEQYKLPPGNELGILFNSAIALFISQRYRACNYWILKIMENSRITNLRKDIQSSTRLLQLLVAFEIDDINLFDSYYRSAARFFQKNEEGTLDGFEKVLMPPLKKIFYADPQEQRAYLIDLKASIETYSKKVPGGIDELAIVWITSKLENQGMETLISQN